MSRTFEAKTTGLTTKDIIEHQSEMRTKQNNLANSGGGPTVPQFHVAGPPAGEDPNANIKKMAGQQLQIDENSKRNDCVGKPAGVGTCGGSRKKKVQYQKKNYKKRMLEINLISS